MAGPSPSMTSTASLTEPSTDYQTLTIPKLRLIDHTLDENLPAIPSPTSSQPYYYTSQPSENLGSLDSLPFEVLHITLSLLDLSALMAFRRVNQRSLQLVAALPQYKVINSCGRSALRGALSTGMGEHVTCNDLFKALCTANCQECGDFGGYLYLLTCTRVCFLCFTRNENYLPLRYSHAKDQFGLERQTIAYLPQMRSLPGTYTPMNKKSRGRITLVDFRSAQAAGIALRKSLAARETDSSELPTRSRISSIPTPRRPRSKAPFDPQSGNPLRFMTIVCVPWFNRTLRDVEWGFYCIGCQKSSSSERNWPMHFRRKFTVTLFNEHLKQCGSINDRRHSPGQHASVVIE